MRTVTYNSVRIIHNNSKSFRFIIATEARSPLGDSSLDCFDLSVSSDFRPRLLVGPNYSATGSKIGFCSSKLNIFGILGEFGHEFLSRSSRRSLERKKYRGQFRPKGTRDEMSKCPLLHRNAIKVKCFDWNEIGTGNSVFKDGKKRAEVFTSCACRGALCLGFDTQLNWKYCSPG